MSYCYTSGPVWVMGRPSALENKYSNIFFYKTTGPAVLKLHMEHDLTPGAQNRITGSGRISKIATGTLNSKNNKTSSPDPLDIYSWILTWNIN